VKASEKGCGNAGAMEGVENHNQVSTFPFSLGDDECCLSFFSTNRSQASRKDQSPVAYSVPFQDHLVLESKFDFRIILRLENAVNEAR